MGTILYCTGVAIDRLIDARVVPSVFSLVERDGARCHSVGKLWFSSDLRDGESGMGWQGRCKATQTRPPRAEPSEPIESLAANNIHDTTAILDLDSSQCNMTKHTYDTHARYQALDSSASLVLPSHWSISWRGALERIGPLHARSTISLHTVLYSRPRPRSGTVPCHAIPADQQQQQLPIETCVYHGLPALRWASCRMSRSRCLKIDPATPDDAVSLYVLCDSFRAYAMHTSHILTNHARLRLF